MIRNVLIVDDDRDLLLMCKEGLASYAHIYSVITAADGQEALEALEKLPVSLVVTDLKMPHMDGFALLTHVMDYYPDIPVMVMTGFGTPALEQEANSNGVVEYIEKPFVLKDLARKIIAALRRESDGGTLRGFTLGTFVQLVEAEQKTCTIRIYHRYSGKKGVLFFRNGELLDARLNGVRGIEAAYAILSWDDVALSIENQCSKQKREINADLQGILIEAMRRKDENKN
jgi:CheY-like chemotaxis protein